MAERAGRYLLGSTGYLAVSVVGRLASIAAVLLLARALDPQAMGTFAFLQATATIALTIGTLNLGQVLNVALAHDRLHRRRSENAMLVLVLGAVGLLSAAIALVTMAFSSVTFAGGLPGAALFGLFVAVTACQTLLQAVAYARGLPGWAATCAALSALALCLGVWLIVPRDVFGALAISTAAIAVGCTVLALRTLRDGVQGKWRFASRLVVRITKWEGRRMAGFAALTLLSGLVLQFALWAIQHHLVVSGNAAENATYAIGLQFFNVVLFLPSLYAPLLVRRLRMQPQPATARREVLVATAVCSVICLAGLSALSLSGSLLDWLVPAKYLGAQSVIWWATLAGVFMFIKFPFSVYFQVSYSGLPDALANLLAAAAIGVGLYAVHAGATALDSSQLRAAACLLQLACVASFFALSPARTNGPMGRPNG